MIKLTMKDLFSTHHLTNAELQQRIYRIYNHLYANAEVKTPHGIWKEVGKILHVGMFIEENDKKLPAFSFSEQNPNIILNDDHLVANIADQVRRSFDKMNKSWQFYDGTDKVGLKDYDIAYTCLQLTDILISDPSRDIFGDAQEIFRIQWAKQMGGQFFTDSQVTMLSMHLLEYDPRQGDDLIDICAGTGGFLLAGLNHIRMLLEESGSKNNIERKLIGLARKSIRGQEIDKEVCEIANETLEARLSKSKLPFVAQGDSLLPDSFRDHDLGIEENCHLCAATNPPFGTKITVKDPKILINYDLSKINNSGTKALSPRAPDILFLEKNVKMLRPGVGRLAIVLPYQIVSGPQTSYIRRWLLTHTQILSVIDLPPETFQPHTGTKTSLVVVRRRKEPLYNLQDLEDYPVFMSMPAWIGHDRRGNPIYTKAPDGKPTNDLLSDFPQVIEAYKMFKKGKITFPHAYSFIISSKKIIDDDLLRVNALFHKPSKYDNFIQKGFRPNKWRVVKLGDLVEKVFYPGRFKRNYVDYYLGAVPFLGGSDITQIINSTGKWLRHDDPHLEDLKVKEGWVLITRSGSTGIISSVPSAWDGFAVSEHVIRVVPDKKKINALYLQLFLRTTYCQDIIAKGVFGSVIDEITPDFICNIEVPIPKSTASLTALIKSMQSYENSRDRAISELFKNLNYFDSELFKE